jgi:hypothetical protein
MGKTGLGYRFHMQAGVVWAAPCTPRNQGRHARIGISEEASSLLV